MRKPRHLVITLGAACALHATSAWCLVDPEDQKLIDAASCEKLAEEHRDFARAEKELSEQMRRDSNSTVATNVAGAALFATIGFGFFTWNDNSDAEGNLAELRAYRNAIERAAAKKNCPIKAP